MHAEIRESVPLPLRSTLPTAAREINVGKQLEGGKTKQSLPTEVRRRAVAAAGASMVPNHSRTKRRRALQQYTGGTARRRIPLGIR